MNEDQSIAPKIGALRKTAARILRHPGMRWVRQWVGPFVESGDGTQQWLRVVMNREVEKLIHGLNPSVRSALEVSGTYWSRPGLFKSYRSVDFPEFDICGEPLKERYDLIIAEQVFEHLLRPYRAGCNVWTMLKPGGVFLVTTPFLLKVHPCPVDCTRWTETGMRYFLAECGFPLEGIQTDSWGSRAVVKANFQRWQIYQSWRHSLRNEAEFPIVVWATAKKPETLV